MTNREKLLELLAEMADDELVALVYPMLCPETVDCEAEQNCEKCWEKYLAEDEEGE